MTPVFARRERERESKGQRSPVCDTQLKSRICVDREARRPAPMVNPAAVKLPTGGHWVLTWREQVLLTAGSPINSHGACGPWGPPAGTARAPAPPCPPAWPDPSQGPTFLPHDPSANTARVPSNGFQHDDLRTSSSTEKIRSPFCERTELEECRGHITEPRSIFI